MITRSVKFVCCILFLCPLIHTSAQQKTGKAILFKDVTLIDGNGGTPVEHLDMLVQDNVISAIGKNLNAPYAKVVNLHAKTIMPALISTHVHVGTLKGTGTKPENYTRDNILRQLKKYVDFGVTHILAMGTDRPRLFESGLYDSCKAGLLPGARMFSAGYGFGVPQGAPPVGMAMDVVYRPASAAQVSSEMDSLAKLKPSVVKMWVDDFRGRFKKMDSAVSGAIIREAHNHQLRVATHLFYLDDAKHLVAAGVDIIAHSIRDKEIDEELLRQMKARGIAYIPTLSLDEFAFIYARKPEWINDPFFKASLEPGVYQMITSTTYQDSLKNAPDYQQNITAFEIALKNLKKIFDAGILVALGTDSGATPLRAQGFSEHLELTLMVQAGLTPLQAITVATKNAAAVLKIDQQYGTLEKGKIADFIILESNPEKDISNTRKISSVYISGEEVSRGPGK